MDALKLLEQARNAGFEVWVEGDLLQVRGPRSRADLVQQMRVMKHELVRLLRADSDETGAADEADETADPRPSPRFPTPDEWITGRNITIEGVGFDRWQWGGRPHALREELRELWLDEYVGAMQAGFSEPEAWARAWDVIRREP